MSLTQHADPPPLEELEGGVVRVAGTRVPLERVVRAFLAGGTPEQIAQDYDSLSVEKVYAVVSFYLRHREEVDAYLAKAEQEADRVREDIEQQFDPAGIRERLLRRKN